MSTTFLASQGHCELFYNSMKGRFGILAVGTTQELLEAEYENTCCKIVAQDVKKKIVFLNVGNLHYAVVALDYKTTAASLKRQVTLFHDLLRFRLKINLNAAPMNAALNLNETRRLVKVAKFNICIYYFCSHWSRHLTNWHPCTRHSLCKVWNV